MENELDKLGFLYNPFEHLDASSDRRLSDYLVIPEGVDIAWGNTPAAIFALPGGGKSALRIYTESLYRGSRGNHFPITCIPGTYSTRADYYDQMLSHAVARSVLIFLFSYPLIFSALSPAERREVASVFQALPFNLPFVLSMVKTGGQIQQLEKLLGVHAISGIKNFDQSHKQLVNELIEAGDKTTDIQIDNSLKMIRELLGAGTIHILLDGLDGFPETSFPDVLMTWIDPLLGRVDRWAEQGVYLKFFLPQESNQLAENWRTVSMKTGVLAWNDDWLSALIRRRVKVSSGSAFESLDAISMPGMNRIEEQVAALLPDREKLPRQMIRFTKTILSLAVKEADGLIRERHITEAREEIYAKA